MMIKYWYIVTLLFKKENETIVRNNFILSENENEALGFALANSDDLIKQGYSLGHHFSEKVVTQVCPNNINGVQVKD